MPWPTQLFEELKRLRTQRIWTEQRPAYLATGLVVTAAALMLVIVSGVKQPSVPVPTAPPARQEAPAEPNIRAEAPVTEANTTGKPKAPRESRTHLPVTGAVRVAFGWQYSPLFGDWRYHPGLDFTAPAGGGVKALWDGQVEKVYEDRQYGWTVVVACGDYAVYYGSLATVKVDRNQRLAAGTEIGTVGEAPAEPYPHLHLAVKSGDKYVDPWGLLLSGE
jgi:Membrane proteins related to metalloendopeptidases